jgi:hypothetical protein
MTPTASIRNGHLFTSPPMKFGKTFWRFVVLPSRFDYGLVTDYEWLNTAVSDNGIWYPSNQWPSYNFNDGLYAGLPKSLRKLWERHLHEYEALSGTTHEPAQLMLDIA